MDYPSYVIINAAFARQEQQRKKWQENYNRSFEEGAQQATNRLERKCPWKPMGQEYDPDGFYDGYDSAKPA